MPRSFPLSTQTNEHHFKTGAPPRGLVLLFAIGFNKRQVQLTRLCSNKKAHSVNEWAFVFG